MHFVQPFKVIDEHFIGCDHALTVKPNAREATEIRLEKLVDEMTSHHCVERIDHDTAK